MEGSTADQSTTDQGATVNENQAQEHTEQQTTTVDSDKETVQQETPVLHIDSTPTPVEPVQGVSVTDDVYSQYVQLPTMTLKVEPTITSGDMLISALLSFMIIVYLISFFHRLIFPKGGAK